MVGKGLNPACLPQEGEAKPKGDLQCTCPPPPPQEKKEGTRTCTEVPIWVEVSTAVQVAAVQDQHGVLVLLQLGLWVPHGPLEGHLAGQGQAQLFPEVR